MRYILPFLLAISPLCAQQPKPIDYALLGVSTTLIVIDWNQTRRGAADPDRREVNPLLGSHPSASRVNTYFAVCALGTLALMRLPSNARRLTWGGVILLESFWILYNRHYGLRIAI